MKRSVAPACASKLYSTSLPAAPARPETGTMLVSGVATGPQFSVHGGWTAAATAAAASTMPAPIGWVGGTLGAWAVVWMIDSTSSRSEEHTSELQSLMRISYAVFCLKKKKQTLNPTNQQDRTEHR